MDAEKTRVYLERSRTAPINVWLKRKLKLGLIHNDPFLQISPHAISRLKHLSVETTEPEHFQDIIRHFCRPVPPLLEVLTIDCDDVHSSPVLPAGLFDGVLSSLRELHLHFVQTELPWKNMNNLTSFSFSLAYTFRARFKISVDNFLDFFERSPHLVEIKLALGAAKRTHRGERRVELKYLRRLSIHGVHPPRRLLDHLSVPVGANVSIKFSKHPGPYLEDHLSRSLDNLKSFSHFTKIRLCYKFAEGSMRFTGPNGQVSVAACPPGRHGERVVCKFLARLDTSQTRCLELVDSTFPTELGELLASLSNLRTLIIPECKDIYKSFLICQHIRFSPNGSLVCPKLEELVLPFHIPELFDETPVVDIAVERALAGSPLKLVKFIFSWYPSTKEGFVKLQEVWVKLQEHVERVEFTVWADYVDADEGWSP